MKTNIVILIALLLFFSFSCTVEKRLYNKGYHVSWDKNTDKYNPIQENEKTIRSYGNNEIVSKKNIHVDELPIKSIKASPVPISRKIVNIQKNAFLDTECDELIYKNGDTENVIVKEINKNEVKYRMCDNQEGPVFIIDKSELFMIKYKNGTKTVLNDEKNSNNNKVSDNENKVEEEKEDTSNQETETEKTTHPLAIWGFVVSILGLLVFFVPIVGALVCWAGHYLSLKALDSIKENPNKYKGKGLARAGQIIAWIGLMLALIAAIALLILVLIY